MAGNRRSIRTWRIRPPTAHSKPAADCEVIGRANPTLVRVADKLNAVVAVSRFRPVLDGLLPMTGATEQLALVAGSKGCGLALALVRDLREHRVPTSAEGLAA
jgi:hypothetical protein